jgi:hypothetical protein
MRTKIFAAADLIDTRNEGGVVSQYGCRLIGTRNAKRTQPPLPSGPKVLTLPFCP